MGLPLGDWIKKTVYDVETHRPSGKVKAPIMKDHAFSLLGHEETHPYRFPWKGCNYKQWIQLPPSQANFL